MQEEYQKTIILLSIIFIFGGLYTVQFFDIGGSRRSNTYLFAILISCVLVGYLQTKKIKRWKEEKKTDYYLVYWCYFYFTMALVGYLIYMIGSRSELECMRLLRINMRGAGNKFFHNLENYRNYRNYGNLDTQTNYTDTNLDTTGKLGKVKSTFNILLNGYKNIWKKMLFIKN